MKYDYLVVGSGLYGAIFAHEAKAHGKSVLVVDKRPNIAGNIYTKNIEVSMFINMVLTFSILITKRFGITSRSLQSLIVSPTHRWLIIKENYSPFRSTCTPLTRCGEL